MSKGGTVSDENAKQIMNGGVLAMKSMLHDFHVYMCVRFTVPRYTIALMAVLGTCLGLAICVTIWPS